MIHVCTWPLGRYRAILGQNRKILWLNHWKLEKMHNYFIVISTVFQILINLMINIIVIFDISNMVCIFHWSFWSKKWRIFKWKPWTWYLWILVFWITQDANFKSMIFWKVKKYTTKWALFALLCLGRYGDILGQNHKSLLKNHREFGKLYNYFIIISILNLKESFYNKCHRLSSYVSKTVCLLFWSFWGKMSWFFVKSCEAI
jgi:hypothetical protein